MTDCITALEYEGGITALDSGMFRPQMAACYLLETDSAVALIEVGSNSSVDRILSVLQSRGRKADEISHRIAELQRMETELRQLRELGETFPTDDVDGKNCVCHLVSEQTNNH